MAENTVGKVLNTLKVNIQLIYEQLLDESVERSQTSTPCNTDEFWKQLNDAGNRLSHEATKTCLLFSKPPFPDPATAEPVCHNIEIACLALISAFYGFPMKEGLTLRKQLRGTVLNVLQCVVNVVEQVSRCNNSKQMLPPQCAGSIWESCEELKSQPKDNAGAVIKSISTCSELVKDALQELEEAIKESLEVPDEDLEMSWRSVERDIARSTLGLVKTALTCLKKVSEFVNAKGSTIEQAHELDEITVAVDSVSPAVDDLVASSYPPIENGIVMENATIASANLRTLLETIRRSTVCKEEDVTWLDFLLKAVDHNLTKVENLTGKSRLG